MPRAKPPAASAPPPSAPEPAAEAPRVRLLDVARAAGVSLMTVSRALRNQPELARATGDRVRAIAQRLGYAPDPALAALAAYRTARRVTHSHATLGFIVGSTYRGPWIGDPSTRGLLDELHRNAAQLGYHIDFFDLRDFKRPERVEKILESRGIRGLLLDCAAPELEKLNWDWSRFSAVSLESDQASQRFHKVCVHHLSVIRRLQEELVARGYRRPGFAYHPPTEAADAHNWSLAFAAAQQNMPEGGAVPHHPHFSTNEDAFFEWIATHRPDVVVYLGSGWIRLWFEQHRLHLPRDIGLIALDLARDNLRVTGFDQRRDALATAALHHLHGMLLRNERGLPRVPANIGLPAAWVEGNTLRRRRASATATAATPRD